jgi:hypothetical protein
MKLFDPFGNPLLIKRVMFGVFGSFFYIGLCVINRLRIEGSDYQRRMFFLFPIIRPITGM